MTHRDPLETVPSYISMQATLYKLGSSLTDREVADFWFPRLVEWMRRFEAARGRIGEDRFLDIDYRAVTREPLAQAHRVLRRIGVDPSEETDAALAEFLAGNRREQRPAHDYSLERFGLDEAAIAEAFADYRARYLAGPEGTL
jgi:hypothetical protein